MTVNCSHCGAEIQNGFSRCQYCGSHIGQQAEASVNGRQVVVNIFTQAEPPRQTIYGRRCSPKSRGLAMLLCLVFGMVGAHKFYLGRLGMGFLYLITGGLFGIGVIVDVLVLILGSPRDGYGKPLRWC